MLLPLGCWHCNDDRLCCLHSYELDEHAASQQPNRRCAGRQSAMHERQLLQHTAGAAVPTNTKIIHRFQHNSKKARFRSKVEK